MSSFDFNHLRCFVAVAEELNFRRAADRLNMTQPPLTRQIQLLEQRTGLKLLDRNTRQVRLTPAGADFLNSATDILERAERAVLSARQAERGETGAVVLGFVPSAAITFVPHIVAAVARDRPGASFRPTEMMSYEIIEGLRSGRLDFGLTRSESPAPEIESVRVVSEPFLLAAPSDHPLARKTPVRIADLNGVDFLGYSDERGGFLRNVQSAVFAAMDVRPNIRHEVSQTQTIIGLVAQRLGVALVPASASGMHLPGVVFCETDLPDRFRSTLYLASVPRRHTALHSAVRDTVIRTMAAL
ncbi:LysR substrate-binding domain-containing protein [Loktanella sp. SALINAS62]|uniref:LysR family transcriptional regulator n=1 Tax=Loktanella sp. SALINAS62 TaxID=2706124 RepID=UPI001B8B5D33|nr:LysR substrate-binding domain-containing protein [Loktanella sp. SALINAS62]MBS1302657.1 LysR family transcriptional regulator [Loktanella sp. SALINAS62]